MQPAEIAALKQAIAARADLEKIEVYFELLMVENKAVNLVSRETTLADLIRLTAESLFPLEHLKTARGRYLDVGSGGGFPAVPLIVAGQGRESAILLERTLKKVDALNRIIRRLDIRAEAVQADFPNDSPELQFDLITLRYVKLTPRILQAALDHLAAEGRFVYYGAPEFDLAGHVQATHAFEPVQGNPVKQVTIFQKR